MIISDFFHLRLGASVGVISNIAKASIKVYSVWSRHAFPTGPCGCLGGGGGGGGQQVSSLSSKHKLWNFHRSCYGIQLISLQIERP